MKSENKHNSQPYILAWKKKSFDMKNNTLLYFRNISPIQMH